MHDALERLFLQLVPETHVTDYTANLGDIYGSMDPLRDAIGVLAQLDPTDRIAVRKALLEIDVQLYHHLTEHIERLRHPLRDLIDSLYDEVDSEEAE